MDIRRIVTNEFQQRIQSRGFQVTTRLLEVAAQPFDLDSVQHAVDEDLRREAERNRFNAPATRQRKLRSQEMHHEQQLKVLASSYADILLRHLQQGQPITESLSFTGQRELRRGALGTCDVYPCERK